MRRRLLLKADEMAIVLKDRAKMLRNALRTIEFDGLEVRHISIAGMKPDSLRIGGVSADGKLVYIDVPINVMPEDARANG